MFWIGIVTNQGGIPQFITKRDFETKFESIIQFVDSYLGNRIPKITLRKRVFVTGLYCASTEKNDKNRKPNIGMLEHLHKNVFGEHSKNSMIMIGDASGKPGDFSDSDRKCAEGFGIDYVDVEDFINNK